MINFQHRHLFNFASKITFSVLCFKRHFLKWKNAFFAFKKVTFVLLQPNRIEKSHF
uniref:Uncharacterized protein n=1 Tax=Klebsiella quasipneumoniae TaxID=1463165 RepID=A0A6M4NR32_9ENTR|nr:hypothetical protein [Klebsiella quasipneumoniae]UMW96641.1 hypothetical protein [Raoultella ornithinolytica]UVN19476.1 hypothetical protein [Klebsiella michiganensis]